MVFHPPMLYLGYTSITVPFAFAVAALISGKLDTGWLHAIRKWTLLSWLFLSCGIMLGMWWAYVELGWGGYWAWDPVENASFLPWLTMTAFLHSVMIQEKRGMLKKWNIALVVALVPALDLRHVPHPERRDLLGPQLLAVRTWAGSSSSSWCSSAIAGVRAAAVRAGRCCEAEVTARVDGEPRGGVPVQQPDPGR